MNQKDIYCYNFVNKKKIFKAPSGKLRRRSGILANFLIFSKKVGNTLDFRPVFLYNKYLDSPNENNKQGDANNE